MYILVMACATVIAAQIAPPAGLDTSACPLNSFVPSLATLDDVCCAGGACEDGGMPKSCSVDCAIVFVPFRDRCRATIDLVYDGSAPQFAAVYDLCSRLTCAPCWTASTPTVRGGPCKPAKCASIQHTSRLPRWTRRML